MKSIKHNIFDNIPSTLPEEQFENLLLRENVKIERIVSNGHLTPTGEWYDQDWDEWILLLRGAATLAYENGDKLDMQTGDFLLIPAHTKHRVEWTQPESNTVWLAIHTKL